MWTVVSELSKRIPGVEFRIGTARVRQFGASEVSAAGIPQVEVFPVSKPRRARRLVEMALTLPGGPRYWYKVQREVLYQQAVVDAVDGIVDVSGFLYVDKRGTSGALKLAPLTRMAEAEGVPYVYLPQTWGPFTDIKLRKIVNRSARSSRLLYTRDALSRQYLADLLNKPVEQIKQSPDIAFLFKGDTPSPETMRDLGLEPNKPILGVAPNMRVYERSEGEGDSNKYLRALSQMIKQLTDRGVQVLLLPHEVYENGKTDDTMLCGLLQDSVASDLVKQVKGNPSAEYLKGVVGGCDMLVGSRFHSLVAAISQGVPAVAVGWAHKYPELLREFGLEAYVYDYDSVSEGDFARVVGEAWDERAELKRRVDEALPHVKKRLNDVFDEVAQTIQEAAKTRHNGSRTD